MSYPYRHRFTFYAMAAEHELVLDAAGEAQARRAADAAIADVARIEAKYSRYRADSLTTQINQAAGGAAVPLDAETAALAEACALIGWRDVEWSDRAIRLPRAGMEIDFGGIGKEYAADRMA